MYSLIPVIKLESPELGRGGLGDFVRLIEVTLMSIVDIICAMAFFGSEAKDAVSAGLELNILTQMFRLFRSTVQVCAYKPK
jgi:hypothetical protein